MFAKLPTPPPNTWNMNMQSAEPLLSRREYVAMHIINGMLSGGKDSIEDWDSLRAEQFYEGYHPSMVQMVVRAFKMADCMLNYTAYEDEYIAVFDNPNEPKSESNHDDIKSV